MTPTRWSSVTTTCPASENVRKQKQHKNHFSFIFSRGTPPLSTTHFHHPPPFPGAGGSECGGWFIFFFFFPFFPTNTPSIFYIVKKEREEKSKTDRIGGETTCGEPAAGLPLVVPSSP
eukprot:Hpha_TRINITY_DN16885_c0_g7::TRINITY_DN16885_c0_g7_i1::g.151147::m.151147